jgi:hypothetical protein
MMRIKNSEALRKNNVKLTENLRGGEALRAEMVEKAKIA